MAPTAGGFGLIRLADNKQHLMPVCLPNHLMIKVFIHRQRPVIGLNQPQHQVEARKLFAVQRSILGIASATFAHTGQVHQRHIALANLQAKAQWLTGTGSHIADRRYLTGKQGITGWISARIYP
jgi:hypothetical protein